MTWVSVRACVCVCVILCNMFVCINSLSLYNLSAYGRVYTTGSIFQSSLSLTSGAIYFAPLQVSLPANSTFKLLRIFPFLFSPLFVFYPEGGLRPGVSALWSRSTPTGMRIVSDLRAAPLASSLPFKAANCRGHKARATADCLLRGGGIFFTDELEPTEPQSCSSLIRIIKKVIILVVIRSNVRSSLVVGVIIIIIINTTIMIIVILDVLNIRKNK